MKSIRNSKDVVLVKDDIYIRKIKLPTLSIDLNYDNFLLREWYCGYVFIPLLKIKDEFKDLDYQDKLLNNINVHGGITFLETEENGIIYGFDCNHYNDKKDGIFSDINNVINECQYFKKELYSKLTNEKEKDNV